MTSRAIGPTEKQGVGLLASLVAGPVILLLPFAIFVQHNSYGLLRGETLLCAGVLGATGLLLGVLSAYGGSLVRAAVLALLIVYVLDVQFDWFESWNVALLGSLAGIGALAWWLGPLATRVAAFGGAVMLVATLILPTGSPAWKEEGEIAQPSPDPDAPPLFIHLILDEQIGIEGIPAEFDPSGESAIALRDFYTSRGFQVFGRAFSSYGGTYRSLVNMLNFRSKGKSRPRFRRVLGDLKYFNEMRSRGYSIHVYQSDFLDLCHRRGWLQASLLQVNYCLTYTLERLQNLGGISEPVVFRAQLLAGMYARLSFLLSELRPAGRAALRRTSSVSAFEVMNRIQRDLAKAGPGQLFVIHLLLPHSPYTYERDCNLRGGPWLLHHLWQGGRWSNNQASRAERYPLYLEQVECLHRRLAEWFEELESAGLLDDAIVLVHGDHGSRIALTFREQLPWPDSAYADSRSTLFAVKEPGRPGGYDRRLLPIGRLFSRFVRANAIPPGTRWAGPSRTVVGDKAVRMKPFAREHFVAR